MEKLILIGPVYPYKGGISHYTGLLYRALEKCYEVEMISYKMQYPRFLFKKEQRDYSNDLFKVEKAKFLIHTANPFNIIKISRKIKKQQPDMVIMQWWHPYFAPCYWLLTKILGKKIKKLFICHNVFPHERFPMDRKLTKVTLKKADYYIVQSKQDEKDLKTIIKNPIYAKAVHPTYNAFKAEGISKEQARQRIGLNKKDKVLLFFGFVREYKGLKYLIKAMPTIKEQISDIKLLVVGDFGDAKQRYLDLIMANKAENEIEIYEGYIPDSKVEQYFAGSDLVVLPYESATQSGIVQIAYGFEKPVIVTNVGGLPDVVTDGKTGYIVEPQSPEKLAEAVIKYFVSSKENEFIENVKKESERFSWDRMVETIEGFLINM